MKIVSKKIMCNLIIIGYGLINFLFKEINDYKLQRFIKIIDYKINPFPYLRASDLFVLTSKFEGLPNVITEAQTLKKYVISTDCPRTKRNFIKW